MSVMSEETGKIYSSWDDMVDAESGGFAVVVIMRRLTHKRDWKYFARTIGPFETKPEAKRRAARIRKQWRKIGRNQCGTHLVAVRVEPLWYELNFISTR